MVERLKGSGLPFAPIKRLDAAATLPAPGADTRTILGDLGLTEKEAEALIASGAVGA